MVLVTVSSRGCLRRSLLLLLLLLLLLSIGWLLVFVLVLSVVLQKGTFAATLVLTPFFFAELADAASTICTAFLSSTPSTSAISAPRALVVAGAFFRTPQRCWTVFTFVVVFSEEEAVGRRVTPVGTVPKEDWCTALLFSALPPPTTTLPTLLVLPKSPSASDFLPSKSSLKNGTTTLFRSPLLRHSLNLDLKICLADLATISPASVMTSASDDTSLSSTPSSFIRILLTCCRTMPKNLMLIP